MKFLISLLFFYSFVSLANTATETYVVAYDWDISVLKLCTRNTYCADSNRYSGRKVIVDGSDISLDMKPWHITFLVYKTDDKEYEIKGRAINTEDNSISNFNAAGRFYLDQSIKFNVGKTVVNGNVFVGKNIKQTNSLVRQ